MKSDAELQKDVQTEITWTPALNVAEIGVTAKNGVITLTGTVDSYSKKLAAENAAKRVNGVKGVAVEIQVKLGPDGQRTDADITASAINALKWNIDVPDSQIKVDVEDGWVTLSGTVDWEYQRSSAEYSVQVLAGVKGVIDEIEVNPSLKDAVEKVDVISALERDAFIDDDDDIVVEVNNNSVKLLGTVNSWFEKNEAERVAWSAPGVMDVDNQLVIDYGD
ncbi:BON domain-containing protein [Puia dinghuensis]|uniref:Tri-BON domain-containing protein n=1 Tax=Puia dinghuensis TaxID=1792502 RepID=A0A8J2XT82_9BACT|nr:BON domain-containing protein [Puia dinghuensis]GGB01932.1 tri-BON domain-containing protein [Puia dinghuensis]